MKKILIGSLVGAIILFVFQAAMWMSGMNNDFSSYTTNQAAIMENLNSNLDADGLYMMPMNDPAVKQTHEQEEKYMQENVGKPWAMVFYHQSMHGMDPMYMVRGFFHSLIAVLMVTLVLSAGGWVQFGTRFIVCMAFGVFTIALAPMNSMNWWDMPFSFVKPQIMDLTLGWALVSLWLASYVKK